MKNGWGQVNVKYSRVFFNIPVFEHVQVSSIDQ